MRRDASPVPEVPAEGGGGKRGTAPGPAPAVENRSPWTPGLAVVWATCLALGLGPGTPASSAAQDAGGAAAAAETAPDDRPSAEEVLTRYMNAAGGEEAIRKHDSRTARGTFSLAAQGIQGELLSYAQAPDRFYLQIDIPGLGLTRTGYDGEVGWMIQPMMGPMVLDGESLAQMKDEADYYELLYEPGDYEAMENLGVTDVAGRPCWKLRLVRRSGYEAFEYFDVDTGLLAAREGEQETPLGAVTVLTLVTEHREFDGVLYPAVMEQELMGMTQVMSFDEVTFGDVPADAFALPKEIQAMVARPAGGKR